MTRLADCAWLEDKHLTPLRIGMGLDVFIEGPVVYVWVPGCWAYAPIRSSVARAVEEAFERAVRAVSVGGGVRRWAQG